MVRSGMKAFLVGTSLGLGVLGTGAAVAFSFVAFAAQAQESAATRGPTLKSADPTEQGDGTLSPAAKAAKEHGPLPFSAADVAAKAAANRAREEAEKSGAQSPFKPRGARSRR